VGLGWIAQESILPAFARARANSELSALVSDDPVKLRTLGRKYGVASLFTYRDYERCLSEVDAVFIAVPNSLHREYTVRAARAGVHVLCEKPMAVTERDARGMLRACASAKVKLMIAYRLHLSVPEATAAVLRFPGERVASFTSSFGTSGKSDFEVFGTKGTLRMSPRPVKLAPLAPLRRARIEHEIHRPAGKTPRLVRADDPRPDED